MGQSWRACLSPALLLFLFSRRPPIPTLFPYTTLFRSRADIMKRIGTVKQTIVGLANMFGDTILSDELLELIEDRKSTRLNSSHQIISYADFCLKKKKREPEHQKYQHGYDKHYRDARG